MSHHIRLQKRNQNKIYIHIHVPYLQQNPPTPECLCEQDSVLQKFIKIYNLPQNCIGYSPPGAQTSLSLNIKYTSPVKVALLRAQWWFLQWREGLGTALSDSAVPTRALQCPQTPGVTPQRALLCPGCVWELDLTKSVGFWVQNALLCTSVPKPGAFQSGQEWPGGAWKSPAKGFLQDIKWLQGSPLASGWTEMG